MSNMTIRIPDHPVEPWIINRWSPRAMSGESLSKEELLSLFEAGRWAPSAYNAQPWNILYAEKKSKHWETLFQLLVEFNQSWCLNAAALFLFFSRPFFEHNQKPSPTHAFDTGAFWENFCLQGTSRGLVVHGMSGFDYEKAKSLIPDGYIPLAMCAVGKKGKIENLPPDLQKKEFPSSRKKIEEFVFEGFVPKNHQK